MEKRKPFLALAKVFLRIVIVKKKNSGLSFSYTLGAVPLLEFLSLLETCPKTDRDGLKEF